MKHPLARSLWRSARRRAREKGLPFNISPHDVIVPQYCPVLGIELVMGTGVSHDASPTLDKIVPDKGYTKGNVVVVSNRANRIKSDATVDELRRLASFYQQLT